MKRHTFILIVATCVSIADLHAQPISTLGGLKVTPSPSLAGQALSFSLSGLTGCGDYHVVESTTTKVGNEFAVVYAVTPGKPTTCFSVPPEFPVRGPIGVLPPGDYTLSASGTLNGVTQKTFKIAFTVPDAPVAAVEFYRADVDHYFITADAVEIGKLDSGDTVGWKRTGETFAVAPPSVPSPSPVCRFYGRPEAGLDSHFFSASPAECDAVAVQFPNAWQLETSHAFGIPLPNEIDGACPVGTEPVYRLYNNRADANHRLTTNGTSRAVMLSKGWMSEGYGPGVAMCTSYSSHF